MKPPVAKRIPHPHALHGDVRSDDYYWLCDRSDPAVREYLEAENAYADAVMKPLEPLTEQLYQDMLKRIQEDKTEVAVREGSHYYYSRTIAGGQYKIHARKRCGSRAQLEMAQEEVLLDLNQMAEGSDYLNVTVMRVCPNGSHLAYLENRDGTDRYTLRVKNLETGSTLPEEIPGVFIDQSLEWDRDGQHLFYITVDESQRPYRLYRHRLGDAGPDALVYEETDITFSLTLWKSRSGRTLFLSATTKVTGEVRLLPADDPEGEWKVFAERRAGIEYDLEDWGDDFLVLTNEGAQNFRLMACAMSEPGWGNCRPLLPYDPEVYLQQMHPFRSHVVLSGRAQGLRQIWIFGAEGLRRLSWPEPVYSVSFGPNREYDTDTALLAYESQVTPRTYQEVEFKTLALEKIQQDVVPGDYDPAAYLQERIWATAEDGTKIPMSVVCRATEAGHGPRPLILYGYGSYGFSMDPVFDASRIPLLDRGVVFVTAHVRGGAELGRAWYEDGKLMNKRHTFTDFVDCAREVIRLGMTTPTQLAARGYSAGGLLMGAVVNLRPDLFSVVLAGVPFVDVMTTMADASIPLTSLEWDEWGNPADEAYYHYMKSYSPYDNVQAKDYPHMVVLTGLNDPRVAYWEPAKWVARLRATKTDQNQIVLRTHMGAGHGGPSGRYARLRETAMEYAFVLHHIGVEA